MQSKGITKRQARKDYMRKQYEIQTGKPWESQFESPENRSPPGHRDV